MNKAIGNIVRLVQKELILEWRTKTISSAILVFVVSTSFVAYMAFEGFIDYETWTALLWIILLFTCFNAVSGSFTREANEQFYYLRTLVRPLELIFSKLIFNGMLVGLLSMLVYFIFSIFFKTESLHTDLFLFVLILGSFGMAWTYTLLSYLTARIRSLVVLAILGFPILLPLLLLCIRISGTLDVRNLPDDTYFNLLAIVLVDMLILLLSVLLFPYLWKD